VPLNGVTFFPSEIAQVYREKGYWDDRLLIEHYEDAFAAFSDRVAVIDDRGTWTYAQVAERSSHLSRVLYDVGLRPLDRVVVQLPNTVEFVFLYLALQHLGAIPIMALPSHRFREVEQFVRLSGAVAMASPVRAKDVDFGDVYSRIASQQSSLRWHFALGEDMPSAMIGIEDLLAREPEATVDDVRALRHGLDPEDPAVFQLSGGTTGIPKLIPRSHNDYAFNSHLAVSVCDVRQGDVLLDVLPISHARCLDATRSVVRPHRAGSGHPYARGAGAPDQAHQRPELARRRPDLDAGHPKRRSTTPA
jgi:2,3-dihydroxybenzoate-AMP ligase